MLPPASRLQVLTFLLLLNRSGSAVHNDATESGNSQLAPDGPEEPMEPMEDTNHASTGGHTLPSMVRNGPDQSQVGCRELRSTKYISDGQCTSANPVKELVCAGECLPAHLLPNWIGTGGHTGRYWNRHNALEWRCVIDQTRTQRIRLQCQDGSSRTYKITAVTSCRCKRYSRQQNDSGHIDISFQKGKKH